MTKLQMSQELAYEIYGRPKGVYPTANNKEVKGYMRLTTAELELKFSNIPTRSDAE